MSVLNSVAEVEGNHHHGSVEQVESATIRLAGDSGDGMQLAGTQFTSTSAIAGNDISTLPDLSLIHI